MERIHLHCNVFGSGSRALLAFHGFGQESSCFMPLATALPDYTVYAVDLFFHGQSLWHHPLQPVTRTKWKQLISELLEHHHIEEFDLIGFSMGGRIALVTYELFADCIKQLWLLAPDGIKSNAWYRLATRSRLLHGLFRYITSEKSNAFHHSMKVLHRYKLLSPTLAKIVSQQMRTPELRKRVYNTWMVYRYLEPDLQAIYKAALQFGPKIMIATGSYDRIIRPHYMKRLTRLLSNLCVHKVFPCGHQDLLQVWLNEVSAANK